MMAKGTAMALRHHARPILFPLSSEAPEAIEASRRRKRRVSQTPEAAEAPRSFREPISQDAHVRNI